MSFDVSTDAYHRFIGRFSGQLAVEFVKLADPTPGERALDVGCGPGAATALLVDLLGAAAVAAVDPSPPFVTAARERFPEADVRQASAERLPFADGSFDISLAQLVVHFMTDPVAGLREMARVTRPGGVVAACVWDHGGGGGPLSDFWEAVHEADPGARDEADLPGVHEGDLARLCSAAGMQSVESSMLTVTVHHSTFDDWWEPYTLGVGPAGDYVRSLDERRRDALRALCHRRLGPAPFDVSGSAWCVRARP